MILSTLINMDALSEAGRSFKWGACNCKTCGRVMWGHGFVLRYFDSYPVGLYLKRYRCRHCKFVYTIRPMGYWPRIRSKIINVFNILTAKFTMLAWPTGCPRQKGRYWLSKFLNFYKMHLYGRSVLEALAFLETGLQSFFT